MPDVGRLTARQKECLRLIRQGYQAKEIAGLLGISPPSVKEHLAAARERLGGVPSSMAAARLLAAAEETPPSGRPPPGGVPDAADPVLATVPAGATPVPPLRDSAVPAAYRAETILARLPLPTPARRENDLTWRGKLLWGLVIAFVSVALVGAFKALFL